MKRFVSLLLILSMILSGCGIFGERIKEPVTFYYIYAKYEEEMAQVIESEEREASGHRDDLSYLLTLYLMGPSNDELKSPLPIGIKQIAVEQVGSRITLQFSDTSKSLSDAEFSLACACLSLTCFDLTDADRVIVISGERSVSMSRDSLTLFDSSTAVPAEETK